MAVAGIGQCCWDILALVGRYPEADGKEEVLALEEQGGGPVATALVALARLGVPCRFHGVVGDDAAGDDIRRSLVSEGVDVAGLVTRCNASSQKAFIAVEERSGRRTIFWKRPTGAPLQPEDLGAEWLEGCRFLHLDGLMTEVSLYGARQARGCGIPVMLDAGRMRPGMREAARKCDYLVAGEQFARDLGWDGTPAGFPGLAERLGPPVVTVTRGERGSITWSAEGVMEVPAFEVAVVDTTGAGDVFHGGYIYGLMQGEGLRDAIRFASAVAALKCTRLGGRTGIPALPEVRRFLAERGGR